jgi:cytochrome c-type biogenesis protein CcmH/NrfG
MQVLLRPRTTVAAWGPLALVAGLTFLTFLPGIFGDFLRWDDDKNYLDHSQWRGLGPRQLAWMLTAFQMGHYHPLTWLTLGADYVLWGMNPVAYHVTSLLLHTATVVAFSFVARRLIALGMAGRVGKAALLIGATGAALLFGVHPLRVESVVWLSERRDTVSGLFYVLTVLAYLKWIDGVGRRRWYWVAVALFACGLLSKALVVTLPAVLVILDVFPLRRLGGAAGWIGRAVRPVWVEKLPFTVLAVAGATVAFLARAPLGAAPSLYDIDGVSRAIISMYGFAFYIWKTVFPFGLSPLYELPSYLYVLAPWLVSSYVFVAVTTVGAVVARRRWPAITAAACAYGVTLLPIVGIVQSGPQITADRYTYLACLGWAVVAGAGIAWLAEHWTRGVTGWRWSGVALCATCVVVVGLMALSARQCLVWRDSITLWRHAIAVDPHSGRAHNGLAAALFDEGRQEEAQRELEEALRLNPRMPEALTGLALVLTRAGRREEAIRLARLAVVYRRGDAAQYAFLAELLALNGRRAESLAAYREAVRFNSRLPAAWYGMAVQLAELRRGAEAIAALEEGHRRSEAISPGDPERDRHTAIVYTPLDAEQAKAAWRRYMLAISHVAHPNRVQIARMVESLGALEALEARTAGPASAPRAESR